MIHVKGRNGWFECTQVTIQPGPMANMASINLYSRRKGDTAPVVIEATLGELRELVDLLQEQLDTIEKGGIENADN